jgi:hypothetical protein
MANILNDGKKWVVFRMLKPPFEGELEYEREEEWEAWIRDNPNEPHGEMYELIATGLTFMQASAMVEMSQ